MDTDNAAPKCTLCEKSLIAHPAGYPFWKCKTDGCLLHGHKFGEVQAKALSAKLGRQDEVSNPDEPEPPELLASKLIDCWCNEHGGQIPWQKAIEICAIITKMPDEEKNRLLEL